MTTADQVAEPIQRFFFRLVELIRFEHVMTAHQNQFRARTRDRNVQSLWLEEKVSHLRCELCAGSGERNDDYFALLSLHSLDGIHEDLVDGFTITQIPADQTADQSTLCAIWNNDADLFGSYIAHEQGKCQF